MNHLDAIHAGQVRPSRTTQPVRATWVVMLAMLFLLSGCVIPPFPGAEAPLPDTTTTPVIAVAPNNADPGDFISVSGAGWQADETIYINIEFTREDSQIATTVAVVTTEEDGRFTGSFFLPDETANSDTAEVTILAYSAASGERVTAPLTILSLAGAPEATETVTATVATATALPTTATSAATPTATAPPPTATSLPPASGDQAQVTSRGLNLRSGPGSSYAIIRSLAFGTPITILGQSSDAYWLNVRLSDGAVGWVARPYTNFTGTAPVVSDPTPVPTPTQGATATPPPPPPSGNLWRTEYFNNTTLSGAPALVRNESFIDDDWGFGSPASSIRSDAFSARWTRTVYLDGGNYRFSAFSDDGVRVWLDGELIIDEWHDSAGVTYTADRTLSSGNHTLRVEYYENTGVARIRFFWERISDFPEWRGEYFANTSLSGAPALVRNERNLDFDYGRGSPDSSIPNNRFSARWTRSLHFDAGDWRFRILVDDGARVFVDDRLIIDEWRDGSVRERTSDIYLGAGTHHLRVEYYENTGDARFRLTWERVDDDRPDSFPDWKGEYWDNRNLSGDPDVVRNDEEIDFNFGNGSPHSRIDDDNFSARWTREVDFRRGLYRFSARADDGIRVWVDGNRIINEWHENDFSVTYTAELFLDGDHDLRVEYFERTGGARVRFEWDRIGDDPPPTPAPNPFADVNPTSGPAGATVIVTGGGFPANTPISVYLGALVRASQIGGEPQPVVSGVTDANGNYRLAFTMPATWPDGAAIEPGELTVVVATSGFGVEAAASFTFTAPRPPVSAVPYVEINPNAGGIDTPVTISGGGFPANTRVNLHLAQVVGAAAADDDPERYASTTTDSNGNFTLAFRIPRQWPNGEDIEPGRILAVIATDNFRVSASASFNYFLQRPTPSIGVAPAVGGAGTQVTVNGEGFPANTAVSAYLGNFGEQVGQGAAAQPYATTTTDVNGRYSLSFAIPAVWPDGSPVSAERLIVTVATSDFGIQASTDFDFVPGPPTATPVTPAPPTPTATPVPTTGAPFISLSPAAGAGGAVVTVSGNNFPANTTIGVYLAAFDGQIEAPGSAQRYATGTTDGAGNYSVTFTMPTEWPDGDDIESGIIVVLVATNDFTVEASALFDFTGVTAAGSEEPAATATAPPTDTPAPTETPLPTSTPVPTETPTAPPTNTPVPTDTPVPTETPTAPPTNTPVPTETPLPTETPITPPADTPTATTLPPAEPITDTGSITDTGTITDTEPITGT